MTLGEAEWLELRLEVDGLGCTWEDKNYIIIMKQNIITIFFSLECTVMLFCLIISTIKTNKKNVSIKKKLDCNLVIVFCFFTTATLQNLLCTLHLCMNPPLMYLLLNYN